MTVFNVFHGIFLNFCVGTKISLISSINITKKIGLLLVLLLLFFLGVLKEVNAFDQVTLTDIRFKSDPPIINRKNRLYVIFNNSDNSNDYELYVKLTYSQNPESSPYQFGRTLKMVNVKKMQDGIYFDDTLKISGNVYFWTTVYEDQSENNKLATFSRIVFVDRDNDGDGIGDSVDPDDDNDGLPDTEEKIIGTDPFNPDTDKDGERDGQDPCLLDPLDSCANANKNSQTGSNGDNIVGSDINTSTPTTIDNLAVEPTGGTLGELAENQVLGEDTSKSGESVKKPISFIKILSVVSAILFGLGAGIVYLINKKKD